MLEIGEFRLKLYPKDFAKVRSFYEDKMSLSVIKEWDRGDDDRGVMFRVGTAVLELLSSKQSYKPISGVDVSLETSDVRGLWVKMKDSDNVVFPLRDNEWGDTSFCVTDPEGFKITFFTKN